MESSIEKRNVETSEESLSAPKKETMPMQITIIGDGQARAVPDQAIVLAIVVGSGASATQALQETAARLTQVAQAVLARGVTQAEVQATWANVVTSNSPGSQASGMDAGYPPPGNGQGQAGTGQAPVNGFVVSYALQILLRDPSRLAEIIDTTMAAGANFSSGGLFRLRDETTARSIALEAACQGASAKAARLAAGLGRPLGGVSSLVEEAVELNNTSPGTGPVAAGSGTGEVVFYSRVRITYELL